MANTPQPGDPFYDPIMDPVLSKLSWEATPRTVIIGLANYIPTVGGGISKAVSLIWPDPESVEKLIKKSEERMKEWVKLEIEQRLAKYDTEKLKSLLEGLRSNLREYVNAAPGKRNQWMDTCISQFNLLKPTFTNPADYHGSLPLVQSAGSLHISLLRERAVYYDEIYKGDLGSEYHKKTVQDDLTQTISDYRDFVINKACPKVIEARKNQITIQNPDPPRWMFHRLTDAGRGIGVHVYSGGGNLVEQYKDFFINDLEVKLQKDVKDVALLWTLLDPNSKDKEPIPRDRVVWAGPVGITQHDIQRSDHGLVVANGYTKNVQTPVDKILLKHGDIIDFIWIWSGNKYDPNGTPRGIRVGDDRPGHGVKADIVVPQGEYIKQIDTYWNYVCTGIQFHFTNGTSSQVFGRGSDRGQLFKAAYPDHVLKSIAVYGNAAGIGEMYFGFSPSPKKLFS
jgi:hypothetical protein